MVNDTDPITLWLGYSWFLGPAKSHLCVTLIDEDGKANHYPLSWDSDLKPTTPPIPGISDTMGISGVGAYLFNSHSKLTNEEEEWRAQVERLERGFERLLADVLQGIVSGALDNFVGNRVNFVIQGPAFPKLLGRLSYRHLRNSKKDVSFYFMTFRRKFLTPSPLLAWETNSSKFEGMIHGPLPSNHEESIIKRYYILPKNEVNNVAGRFCPLMLEFFQQNEPKEEDNNEMAVFLSSIGLKATPRQISVDSNSWSFYPASKAFQVVMVPAPLLLANRSSKAKLHTLLGELGDTSAEFDAEHIGKRFMEILSNRADENRRALTFVAARTGDESDSLLFKEILREVIEETKARTD